MTPEFSAVSPRGTEGSRSGRGGAWRWLSPASWRGFHFCWASGLLLLSSHGAGTAEFGVGAMARCRRWQRRRGYVQPEWVGTTGVARRCAFREKRHYATNRVVCWWWILKWDGLAELNVDAFDHIVNHHW